MVRRWPVFGVALAGLWLFVRGVELTPTRILAESITGLGFGLPVAYLLRGFYVDRVDLAGGIRAIPWALRYGVVFLTELLTANVDVAYRVLAPSMPITPEVIEVPLRVESDLAVTTIANSITLTPGTLTMDYDSETNTLYVHAISGENREAVVGPIRTWEDYALRIFAEERAPDDPVPPRPSVRAGGAGEEGTTGAGTESPEEGRRDG